MRRPHGAQSLPVPGPASGMLVSTAASTDPLSRCDLLNFMFASARGYAAGCDSRMGHACVAATSRTAIHAIAAAPLRVAVAAARAPLCRQATDLTPLTIASPSKTADRVKSVVATGSLQPAADAATPASFSFLCQCGDCVEIKSTSSRRLATGKVAVDLEHARANGVVPARVRFRCAQSEPVRGLGRTASARSAGCARTAQPGSPPALDQVRLWCS